MALSALDRNGFGKDTHCELLIHANGTNGSTSFTDSSSNNFTITNSANSVVVSTAQSVFGGASAQFYSLGVGTYLTVADNAILRFGTNPFCIDFRIRMSTLSQNFAGIIVKSSHNTAGEWAIIWNTTNGFRFVVNNTNYASTGTSGIAANTWYHLSFTRSGGNIRSYVDGVLRATSANTTNFNSTRSLIIGK